ncbi:ATP-binding protein [Kitasatospora griseola]|uniref:ATP-binding protein n=1 Tax=Kitasatospora griseola TaxID=2064 RepID=UPI00380CB815
MEAADRGPGLTPAERERVFDRFHRTDGSRNRTTGGSGLGLAIAQALVTAPAAASPSTPRPARAASSGSGCRCPTRRPNDLRAGGADRRAVSDA